MSPQSEMAQQQEEAKARENEMRQTILAQILTQEARARLGRIRSVKPEKVAQIEDMLLRMAQSGQLNSTIDEPQLVGFLNQVSLLLLFSSWFPLPCNSFS
eukprot:Sdes_comp16788_c0_seq2m6036